VKSAQGQTQPLARKEGLVVHELPDEVLVYDTETDRAHCLNQTAAFVWKRCDGRKSASEIARELSVGNQAKVDQRIVNLALDELSRRNLLIGPVKLSGLNRREIIRALAVSAVALPVVASIVAPQPAEAASCLPNGSQCGTSAQCCSGLCSDGICSGGF